jgi:hypothetical protein
MCFAFSLAVLRCLSVVSVSDYPEARSVSKLQSPPDVGFTPYVIVSSWVSLAISCQSKDRQSREAMVG